MSICRRSRSATGCADRRRRSRARPGRPTNGLSGGPSTAPSRSGADRCAAACRAGCRVLRVFLGVAAPAAVAGGETEAARRDRTGAGRRCGCRRRGGEGERPRAAAKTRRRRWRRRRDGELVDLVVALEVREVGVEAAGRPVVGWECDREQAPLASVVDEPGDVEEGVADHVPPAHDADRPGVLDDEHHPGVRLPRSAGDVLGHREVADQPQADGRILPRTGRGVAGRGQPGGDDRDRDRGRQDHPLHRIGDRPVEVLA